MYEKFKPQDLSFLDENDKELFTKISTYSETVMGDIDPQKVRISEQLEKLKPVMEEIADARGMALEDVFIKYMDVASLVAAKRDQRFKSDMQDLGIMEFK